MIRSLYLRIVLAFMASVMVGLIVAFFTMNYWFRDQVTAGIRAEPLKAARDAAETFAMTQGVDLDTYLRSRYSIQSSIITLFDSSGRSSDYGKSPSEQTPSIPREAVERVLQGQIYENGVNPPEKIMVGYPITAGQERYALFLRPDFMKPMSDLRRILLTALAIVLITGSLLILITARYLVQPLKLMTRATKRIAKGDFNIHLRWKRAEGRAWRAGGELQPHGLGAQADGADAAGLRIERISRNPVPAYLNRRLL
ncbi:cell wall metabolism sensor histidine kinase WalK [Paenibacillus sp. P25]|nr:cell wall metabolism sensor histidine kinase WalK [Paenibacillus sp. P25]